MDRTHFLHGRPEEAQALVNAMGNVQCCAGGVPRSKLLHKKGSHGSGRRQGKPYRKKAMAAGSAGGRAMKRCELQTALQSAQDWLEQCLAKVADVRRACLTSAAAAENQAELRGLDEALQRRCESIERLLLCCHDYLDANDYRDVAFDVDVGTLERAWRRCQQSVERMLKHCNDRVPLPPLQPPSVVEGAVAASSSPDTRTSAEDLQTAAGVGDKRLPRSRRSSTKQGRSFDRDSSGSSTGRKYVAHLTWQYRAVIRNVSQRKLKPRSRLSSTASDSSSLASSGCADGMSPPITRGKTSAGRVTHRHRGDGAENEQWWPAESARHGMHLPALAQEETTTDAAAPRVPRSCAFYEHLSTALSWADCDMEEVEEDSGTALDSCMLSTQQDDVQLQSTRAVGSSTGDSNRGFGLKRSHGVHEELSSFALPLAQPEATAADDSHCQPEAAGGLGIDRAYGFPPSNPHCPGGVLQVDGRTRTYMNAFPTEGNTEASDDSWALKGGCSQNTRTVDAGEEEQPSRGQLERDSCGPSRSCMYEDQYMPFDQPAMLLLMSKDVEAVDDFLKHYKAVLSWLAEVKCLAEHRATSVSERHLCYIYYLELSHQNSVRWQAMESRRQPMTALQPELLQEVDQRLSRIRVVRDQLMSDLSAKMISCSFEKMAADAHHELDVLSIRVKELETALSCARVLLDGDHLPVEGVDRLLLELRAEQRKAEESSRTASVILRLSQLLQDLVFGPDRSEAAAVPAGHRASDVGDINRQQPVRELGEDLEAIEEEAARVLERWQIVWLQTVEQQGFDDDGVAGDTWRPLGQWQTDMSCSRSPSLNSLLSSSPDETDTKNAVMQNSFSSLSACTDEDDNSDSAMTVNKTTMLKTGRAPLCSPEASTLTLQLHAGINSDSMITAACGSHESAVTKWSSQSHSSPKSCHIHNSGCHDWDCRSGLNRSSVTEVAAGHDPNYIVATENNSSKVHPRLSSIIAPQTAGGYSLQSNVADHNRSLPEALPTARTSRGYSSVEKSTAADHAYRPCSVTSDYCSAAGESFCSSMYEESKSLLMTSSSAVPDSEYGSPPLLSPRAASYSSCPSPGYESYSLACSTDMAVTSGSHTEHPAPSEVSCQGTAAVNIGNSCLQNRRKAATAKENHPTSPSNLSYETTLLSSRSRSFHTVESKADSSGHRWFSETVYISCSSLSEISAEGIQGRSDSGNSRVAVDALGCGTGLLPNRPPGAPLEPSDSKSNYRSPESRKSCDSKSLQLLETDDPHIGTGDILVKSRSQLHAVVTSPDIGSCNRRSEAKPDAAFIDTPVSSTGNESQRLLGRVQLQFAPIDCKASAAQDYLYSRSRHRRSGTDTRCRSEARLWLPRPRGRCFSAATSISSVGGRGSSGSLDGTLSAPALNQPNVPTTAAYSATSSYSSNTSTSQSAFSNCCEDNNSLASLGVCSTLPSSPMVADVSSYELDQQFCFDVSGGHEMAATSTSDHCKGCQNYEILAAPQPSMCDDAGDAAGPHANDANNLAEHGASEAGMLPTFPGQFCVHNLQLSDSSILTGQGSDDRPSDMPIKTGQGTSKMDITELPVEQSSAPECRQQPADHVSSLSQVAPDTGCIIASSAIGRFCADRQQTDEQVLAYQLSDGNKGQVETAVSALGTQPPNVGRPGVSGAPVTPTECTSVELQEAAAAAAPVQDKQLILQPGDVFKFALPGSDFDASTTVARAAELISNTQPVVACNGGKPINQVLACCTPDSDDDSLSLSMQSSGRASVDSTRLCGSDDSSSCCAGEISGIARSAGAVSDSCSQWLVSDPCADDCSSVSSNNEADDLPYSSVVCLSQSVPSIPLASSGRLLMDLRANTSAMDSVDAGPYVDKRHELAFLDRQRNLPSRSERESSVETLKAADDAEDCTSRKVHGTEFEKSRSAKQSRNRKRKKQQVLHSNAANHSADECPLDVSGCADDGLGHSADYVTDLDSLSTSRNKNLLTSATTGACDSSDDTDELLQPSSFSETAWDSYQERYNTSDLDVEESCSTTNVADTYPFLFWDDDLSLGTGVDDAVNESVVVPEPDAIITTTVAAGLASVQSNSDSDLDDLEDVLQQSSRQLIVMERMLNKAAEDCQKPFLTDADLHKYDQWRATCRTNLKCLKAISDHLGSNEASRDVACSGQHSLLELVDSWQKLEVRACDFRQSVSQLVGVFRLVSEVRHKKNEAERLLAACSSLDSVATARAHLSTLKGCRKMLRELKVPPGATAANDHVCQALARVKDEIYQCENRLRSRIRNLTNFLRLWLAFEEDRRDLSYIVQQADPTLASRAGRSPAAAAAAADTELARDTRARALKLQSQAQTLAAVGSETVSSSWSERPLAIAAQLADDLARLSELAHDEADSGGAAAAGDGAVGPSSADASAERLLSASNSLLSSAEPAKRRGGGGGRVRAALTATAVVCSCAVVALLLFLYLQPVCCDYSGSGGGDWGLSTDYVNGLPPV